MNRQETVQLTHIVLNLCPQQQINEYTPDSWYPVLGDLDFADCCTAVQSLGRAQVFIAPAEIRAEVRRMRSERIARSVIPAPPPELADDPRAYQRALQDATKQAADGQGIPATNQTPAITAGEPPRRQIPVSADTPTLRQAITQVRRAIGTARARRRPAEIPDERRALEQAAESRASRPAEDEREAS